MLYGVDIRIKQVLVNFANNAVKFTESGSVKIVLEHDRTKDGILLKISVKDTCIGVKPEDMEKLFSSFQQVDSKRNRNVEGTGLGLAISREFVRMMDGEIHGDSKYGEGSTFSFVIPQKIVNDVESIALKVEKPVKAAYMISNFFVREGYLKASEQLGIQNICCPSKEALKKLNEMSLILFLWTI